jgi:hypothetical protein
VFSNQLGFRDAWEHFAHDDDTDENEWALFAEDDVAWNPEFLRAAEVNSKTDWGVWDFLSLAADDGFAFWGVCKPEMAAGWEGMHAGVVTDGRVEMGKGCGTCAHAVRITLCLL